MAADQDQLPAENMPEPLERVELSYGGNHARFEEIPEPGDKIYLLLVGEVSKVGTGTRKKGGIYHFATVVAAPTILTERQAAKVLA